MKVPPSLRPLTAGLYISSACAGGFTNVLCALKALLEHDVHLNVVLDHTPPEGADL